MDKMFKLGGKQLGERYFFKRNGEKFEIKFGYSGAVYYGHLDLVSVIRLEDKLRNTFNLKELCNCYYDVDDKLCRTVGRPSIIVKDFEELNRQIVEWIDFVAD